MEKIELLEKLTTPRLLAYYRSKRNYIRRAILNEVEEREWNDHLKFVKSMLDKREHVEK